MGLHAETAARTRGRSHQLVVYGVIELDLEPSYEGTVLVQAEVVRGDSVVSRLV